MSYHLNWQVDYCLACDRQTTAESAYCSQSCRLADLENSSNGSEPSSPMTPNGVGSWNSPSLGSNSGFYLPPPINFAAYRTPPSSRIPSSALKQSTQVEPPKSSYPTATSFSTRGIPSSSTAGRPKSGLTPSSSRCSLSSLHSFSSSSEDSHLSEQARVELRNYANSFDRGRDWKRRITL